MMCCQRTPLSLNLGYLLDQKKLDSRYDEDEYHPCKIKLCFPSLKVFYNTLLFIRFSICFNLKMEPYTKPFQMPFIYQETDLELQMPDQSTRFLYIFNEN